MGKVEGLEEAAKNELLVEDEEIVKEEIKGRLREIRSTKAILRKLEERYSDLLGMDIEDVVL